MKRGTVVLTPFPFTDLSGRKVRPAVVVSRSDQPGNDVTLAFVTSHRGQPPTETELLIDASDPDFAQTGLKVDSVVKCDKLVTLESSILLGELGELSGDLLARMDDRLRHALEL